MGLTSISSGVPTRLVVAIELALFLAAPVFLLGVAFSRCGIQGIVVPAATTILGEFALLALTRTWGTFFLANTPLALLGPLYAWYVTAFATPFDENALAVISGSSVEEALGFIRLENLLGPLALWVALTAIYVALARRLRHVRLAMARRIYFISAIP